MLTLFDSVSRRSALPHTLVAAAGDWSFRPSLSKIGAAAGGTGLKYALSIALFVIMIVAFIAMRGYSGCERSEPPIKTTAHTAPSITRPQAAPGAEPPPPASPLDPAQQAFADRFIAATNSHDTARMIELLAPAVHECVNDDTRAFFERDLGRQAPAPVQSNYTAYFEELEPGEITARSGLSLPVPPTHQLTITYTSGEDEIELSRTVALVDGKWYLVAPCPGDDFMAKINRRADRRKEIEEQVQRIYSSLDRSTRLELTGLLGQGKKSEAYMELRRRQEMSPPVAIRVIGMLEKDAAPAARGSAPGVVPQEH